ncbi:hypothetical protein H4219_004594 [Mycoemilia scoparia]|uniref:Uncharacterized protein n=1 Tax=Mycoemilia scoparia TaxID=417184 RepID=A0A9W8A0P8_9FUNG|nr:hypothetical protein H4219_004594 [Mycoemilia scoparia]
MTSNASIDMQGISLSQLRATVNNQGPDEDEHYELKETRHPNKSHRKFRDESSTTPGIASNTGTASIGNIDTALIQTPARQAKDAAIRALKDLQLKHLGGADISSYINDAEASIDDTDQNTPFPKVRAAWTREEDRLLILGVKVYGPNTESWPKIATLVPGRTNKSCRKRWFHSLDPTLHKGPWTAEEDRLLRERVAKHPGQWSRVAEGIQGRTDDQCAKRWRESLDPEIDRTKWRPEEDQLLLEKYSEFGTQWQKIATFFKGRPGLHCRNRWRKIQRMIKQQGKTDNIQGNTTQHGGAHKDAQSVVGSNPSQGNQDGQGSRPQSLVAAPHESTLPIDSQASYVDNQIGGVSSEDFYQNDTSTIQSSLNYLNANAGHALSHAQIVTSAPASNQNVMNSMPQYYSMGDQESDYNASYTSAGQQTMLNDGNLQSQTTIPSCGFSGNSVSTPGTNAAKRTSSALFTPTEEQRRRLRQLGLKLYGCSAAKDECFETFSDVVSLNTHIKFCHPTVAQMIPSLGGATGLQTPGGLPKSKDAVIKPYKCAMPGCERVYKNVNGLEYHIFHSKRASSHLNPETYQMALQEMQNQHGKHHIDGSSLGLSTFSQLAPKPESSMSGQSYMVLPGGSDNSHMAGGNRVNPFLRCTNPECSFTCTSGEEYKAHISEAHIRPIKRAVKPSSRTKGGEHAFKGATRTIGGPSSSSMSKNHPVLPNLPTNPGFFIPPDPSFMSAPAILPGKVPNDYSSGGSYFSAVPLQGKTFTNNGQMYQGNPSAASIRNFDLPGSATSIEFFQQNPQEMTSQHLDILASLMSHEEQANGHQNLYLPNNNIYSLPKSNSDIDVSSKELAKGKQSGDNMKQSILGGRANVITSSTASHSSTSLVVDGEGRDVIDMLSLATVPPGQSQSNNTSGGVNAFHQSQIGAHQNTPSKESIQFSGSQIAQSLYPSYFMSSENISGIHKDQQQSTPNTPHTSLGDMTSRINYNALLQRQYAEAPAPPFLNDAGRRPRSFPAVTAADSFDANSQLQMLSQMPSGTVAQGLYSSMANTLACPQPSCTARFSTKQDQEHHVRFAHPRDPKPLLSLPASPENEVPGYSNRVSGYGTGTDAISTPNWIFDFQNSMFPVEDRSGGNQPTLSQSVMDSIASRIAQSTLSHSNQNMADSPSTLPASIATIVSQPGETSSHQHPEQEQALFPQLNNKSATDTSFIDFSSLFSFGDHQN